MTTMKISFGTVLISLSLVYVLTKSVGMRRDGRRLVPEDQNDCYHLLTDRQGSIPLWSANDRHTACLLEINVETAISLTVYVRPRGQMTSSTRGHVALYGEHPGILSSRPLSVWSSQKNATLLERLDGSRLWLVVSTSGTTRDKVNLVLDYAADTTDNANACTPIPDSAVRFGKIRFKGSKLGSKAQLVCNEGYILTNGSGRLECVVGNGQLVWSGDGSVCESVCKYPWPVEHGTYSLRQIREKDISGTDPPRNPEVRSIVRYVCDNSYQLIGNPVSHCKMNNEGVPVWSSAPPVCQRLLDCSQNQVLNAEAGQIVSPKSPSGVLHGGSLNCTWKISSRGRDVLIHVRRYDLPTEDGVALELSDPESQRMLRLTGKASGERYSFGSASLGVAVTYHGPEHDDPNHTGFVLEYVIVARSLRLRREADSSDATTADLTSSAQSYLSSDESSYHTVSDSSDTTTEQTTLSVPMPSSSLNTTPLNPFGGSITDAANEQSTQTGALPALITSYPPVGTASDTPYAPTTLAGDADTTSGVVVSEQTAGADNHSMPWNASLVADTTPGLTYDNVTDTVSGDVASSLITSGTDDVTGMYGVTTRANPPEESDNGWKIALGITLPLIGIGLILLVGYIVYRKKYPVRMIIGREFAKFSNPVYSRSKHAPSLVRDDAEDYFSSRASSSVNLDEMNPVNQNIHYNAAFVSEEDEQDKRFIEQKAWLFAKTANGSTSRPMSEITLCSNDSAGSAAAARIDSTDSLEVEIDKLLGQQKRTPRIKPKRKKLQSRSSSSSVETLSETTSAAESVDLPEGPTRSPETLSEDRETATGTPLEESTVSSSLDSNLNKESTYMKLSKIILEQPTFDEVCAEARSRSRSLSIDRNMPEKRLRSYSVDPFKSARKSSLRNEDLVVPESVETIGYGYGSILARAIGAEMLAQSTPSLTSIISETSVIDESMLDGLPDVARERCLSMTSQNSNRHLVTDLDDVSVGGNSHRSDVNAEDAPKPVRDDNEQRSEFPAGITTAFPKDEENRENILEKQSVLQYDDAAAQWTERGDVIKSDGGDQVVIKARDHLPAAGFHLEQDGDFKEESASSSLEPREGNALAEEEPGKARVVRFDSVQGSDDGQEQGQRWSSRTLSTTSRGSSLSVSSGVSVSTATSSESDETGSYSFDNQEGGKSSGKVEDVSEEESEDGRFPPSPSHSPTPLTDARSSTPLSLRTAAGASPPYFRSLSTEKSSGIPEKSSFISELDLSESSSDSSGVEEQSGTAAGLAHIRHLPRQESVFSSGDDENGTTSLTVDDIALVLDGVSGNDDHANGALRLDRPSSGNSDSTKQNTLTLTDVIVEDDIEV